MKYLNRILAAMAVSVGFLAVSCEDQPDAFQPTDGVPSVNFIRYADKDVVINSAYMQETVCIVGENLRSINQLWFNDREAVLNTSFMTENTLVVTVPRELPVVQTDKIYMITAAKDTVTYDFKVLLPAPQIKSMSCEFQKPGEEVTIYGNYFKEPMTITFEDGNGPSVTEFKKVTMTEATFTIPADAKPGKVKIETESGLARSPFSYYDFCDGLITDFDGPNNSSSTHGVVPQGWNFKGTYSSEGGITGNYVELKSANPMSLDGGWNEDFKIDFWCGNWNGDPMSITSGAGVPLCNIIDFTDFQNMALKFELYIPSSNPWMAGAMQLIFCSAERAANDSWQNNTFVHASASDPAGLDLCRGLYRPWEATGSFDTGDKWITVTVPFSEFKYNSDGTDGKVRLERPEDFASFVIWPWSGGVNGVECTPVFRIDNLRAVPAK
jgi:hypothetical protein